MYIFVRQYNDNQISLLKQQVKKCPIINITSEDIQNYEQCVNNYIKNNINMKNIIIIYLHDANIILNNMSGLVKNLNDNQNIKYCLGQNFIKNTISNPSKNYDLVKLKLCKEILATNYEELTNDTSSWILYMKSVQVNIIFNNLINIKYPIKPKQLTNTMVFSELVEIHLFIDTRAGFIKNCIKNIINLNYEKKLMDVYIYNNFSRYNWLNEWIYSLKLPYNRIIVVNMKHQDTDILKELMYYKSLSLLNFKKMKKDYYFTIDNMHIIDNPNALKELILQRKDCIIPLMTQLGDTRFTKCFYNIQPDNDKMTDYIMKNLGNIMLANFWMELDDMGHYKENTLYNEILKGNKKDIYLIPYFHNPVLLSKKIVNDYDLSRYHIRATHKYGVNTFNMDFCYNMRKNGVNMYLYAKNVIGRVINSEYATKYWDKDNINLYLIHDSIIDWGKYYINENILEGMRNNINNIDVTEVIKDAYTFMLFTPRFCSELIQESEKIGDWYNVERGKIDKRSGSYETYPTQDIHLSQLGLGEQWSLILSTYIAPMASHLYSNLQTEGTNIVFVVKYSMDGQKLLDAHHDTSTYSINVTLNESFTGGGTYFVRQKYLQCDNNIGQLLMHPGRCTHYHAGKEITSGTRYILVAFIH